MSEAQMTTDHAMIRTWVEAREGTPSRLKTREPGGLLRIDFGEPEDRLEPISWDEFFRIFDENRLAFLYQDKTESGDQSLFNKFVPATFIEQGSLVPIAQPRDGGRQ